MRAPCIRIVIALLLFYRGAARRGRPFRWYVADNSRASDVEERTAPSPLAALATIVLASNPVARRQGGFAGNDRRLSSRVPRSISMNLGSSHDKAWNNAQKRRDFLSTSTKGLLGVGSISGAASFVGKGRADAFVDEISDAEVANMLGEDLASEIRNIGFGDKTTESQNTASVQDMTVDGTTAESQSTTSVEDMTPNDASEASSTSELGTLPALDLNTDKEGHGIISDGDAETSLGMEQFGGLPASVQTLLEDSKWKGITAGAFAAIVAAGRLVHREMLVRLRPKLVKLNHSSWYSDAETYVRRQSPVEATATMATRALETELGESAHSLNGSKAIVDELQENITSLRWELAAREAALQAQESKADTEATHLKRDVKKYALQVRALRSERDSIAVAHQEAVTKLAAQVKATVALEAMIEKMERDMSSLEASLNDTNSVETTTLESTLALESGKRQIVELQKNVTALVADLATSEAALQAQEARAFAEATAMKKDVEKYVAEVQSLRTERDAITNAHDELKSKLVSELKTRSSLEAKVTQLEKDVSSLKSLLKDVEAKADVAAAEAAIALQAEKLLVGELQGNVTTLLAELTTSEAALQAQEAKAVADAKTIKREVERYALEAQDLRSERDSIAASLKQVETKLTAEVKTKASLEAKMAQSKRDVSSLEASLKDAESKAASDRMAFQAKTQEATVALERGKMRVDQLHKQVTTLTAELATRESALEQLEAKTDADAVVMKTEAEKFALEARTLRSERDEAEEKLQAELNTTASLEAVLVQMESEKSSLEASLKDSELTFANDIKMAEARTAEAMAAIESGEIRVNDLQGHVATLVAKLATSETALEAQEKNALAEATAMKRDMKKYATEASALRSERDSIAAAYKEAQAKLEEKDASLQSILAQKDRDVSSLEALLKDTESKAANDRKVVEVATAKATTALEKGKVRVDELQEEAQALRFERDSLAAEREEAIAELEVELELKASLEAMVEQKDKDLSSLEELLKDAESKIAKERHEAKVTSSKATEAIESGRVRVDALQEEARALQSERDSLAVAHREAESRLAAELEAKASLEAKLLELEKDVSSLERSAEYEFVDALQKRNEMLESQVAALSNSLARADAKRKREQERRVRAEWHQR